jgi:hypothetical protein
MLGHRPDVRAPTRGRALRGAKSRPVTASTRVVLAGREVRVGPGGACSAVGSCAGREVPFTPPARARARCVCGRGCALRGGERPQSHRGGVAGFASFAHCLGAQSPLGSRIFFFLFSRVEKKKKPNPLYPFSLKKVCKVCKVCQYPIYPPPTGYTHGHTASGPVRVVCAPRCEARGPVTSTHTLPPRPSPPPHASRLTRSARRTRPPPARPRPTCARRGPCRTPPSPAAPAHGRAPPPSSGPRAGWRRSAGR